MDPHAPGTLLLRADLGATTQSTALSAQGHGLHSLLILLQLIFPRDSLATGDTQGTRTRASAAGHLGVQWLRILLPVQGTWVRSLVQEDPRAAQQLGPSAGSACSTTGEAVAMSSLRGTQSSPHSARVSAAKATYNTWNNNGI